VREIYSGGRDYKHKKGIRYEGGNTSVSMLLGVLVGGKRYNDDGEGTK